MEADNVGQVEDCLLPPLGYGMGSYPLVCENLR
jgi:hypothetical protein